MPTRKSVPPKVVERSSEGEDENESSDQEAQLVQKAQELLDNASKRRNAKRKQLDQEINSKIDKAYHGIQSLYEERKAKVIKLQKAKYAELEKLIDARKKAIVRIAKAKKAFDDAICTVAKEIEAVYGGLLEDIRELETTKQADG